MFAKVIVMKGASSVEISLPKVAIGVAWICTALIFFAFLGGVFVLPKTVVIPSMISFFVLALGCSIAALFGSRNWHGWVLPHALAIIFISVVSMVMLLPFAPILNRIFRIREIPAQTATATTSR